jgi:mannosyltransferase OCH1-like enzyme
MYNIVPIIIVYILIYIYPFTIIEKLPYEIQQCKYYRNIPLLIHRTQNYRYTNGKMFKECHTKWMHLNPGYQMRWYTPRQCGLFLKEFNVRVFNAFERIKPGAFKADLWRLCILYSYGGIYVDSQTTPFESMNLLLKHTRNQEYNFISALDSEKSGSGIHNGFIISSPKHPFLKQCIYDIIENIEMSSYTDNVLAVTGPLCLARSIRKVIGNVKFRVGYNYHGNLTFYLLKFEWGISQYIYDRDIRIMSKKYNVFEYFYNNIINKNKTYSYMWRNKLIY